VALTGRAIGLPLPRTRHHLVVPDGVARLVLRVLFAVYVAATAVHIGLVMAHEPFAFDAWNIAVDTHAEPFSLARFFDYGTFEYTHSNPRIGQWLTYLAYKLEYFAPIATPIAYLGLAWAVAILGLGRWPGGRRGDRAGARTVGRDLALCAIAIGFAWFAIPRIGMIMFCRAYGANYLYGAAIQLWFLVPLRLSAGSHGDDHASRRACLAYLVLGIIAGMCNEHTGPTLVLFMVGHAVWRQRATGRTPRLAWAGAIGSVIGFAAIFFAPGQASRYEGLATKVSLVGRLIQRGITSNLDIFRDWVVACAPVLGLLVIALVLSRRDAIAQTHLLGAPGKDPKDPKQPQIPDPGKSPKTPEIPDPSKTPEPEIPDPSKTPKTPEIPDPSKTPGPEIPDPSKTPKPEIPDPSGTPDTKQGKQGTPGLRGARGPLWGHDMPLGFVGLVLAAGTLITATVFVSPKLGPRFYLHGCALVLAGFLAVADQALSTTRRLAPFVVLAIAASVYAGVRSLPLYYRLAAASTERLAALAATPRGGVFTAESFEQVDDSWWFLGDDFRDVKKRDLVASYFGLHGVIFRAVDIDAPLGVSDVRLVPRYQITPASCLDEHGGLDLGTYRGIDIGSIHKAMQAAVERLRERIAPTGRLDRLDLVVDFTGAPPPLPRPTLLVGRWLPTGLEAHAGAIERKGTSKTRAVKLPKELVGTDAEIYAYQVNGEARRLGTARDATLEYMPWKRGAYWALACHPTECFVIAATRVL
jgi:Family of unknown function (DUF6056)